MVRLICESCGGPLPAPGPGATHLTCAFCDTTTALHGDVPVAAGAQASAVALRQRYEAQFQAFEGSLAQQQAGAAIDEAAFVQAATASLGPICDPRTLARVTFGLAAQFETQHRVDLRAVPNALARVAIAYLASLADVRAHGRAELRVPFIATTNTGPVDFVTTVDVASLQALARADAPQEPRGLFRRLFGG